VYSKGATTRAKLAAERRFKRPDGPRYDLHRADEKASTCSLPRPLIMIALESMDLEQRIRGIHRLWSSFHTAKSITSIGRYQEAKSSFLLKANFRDAKDARQGDEFASSRRTCVARSVGQLSERRSYDRTLSGRGSRPTMVRPVQKIDHVASDNASTARQIVWETFPRLDELPSDDSSRWTTAERQCALLYRYFQAPWRVRAESLRILDTHFRVQTDEGSSCITMSRGQRRKMSKLTA